jgi:hypothetical protein
MLKAISRGILEGVLPVIVSSLFFIIFAGISIPIYPLLFMEFLEQGIYGLIFGAVFLAIAIVIFGIDYLVTLWNENKQRRGNPGSSNRRPDIDNIRERGVLDLHSLDNANQDFRVHQVNSRLGNELMNQGLLHYMGGFRQINGQINQSARVNNCTIKFNNEIELVNMVKYPGIMQCYLYDASIAPLVFLDFKKILRIFNVSPDDTADFFTNAQFIARSGGSDGSIKYLLDQLFYGEDARLVNDFIEQLATKDTYTAPKLEEIAGIGA